jgi:hypothetical protein
MKIELYLKTIFIFFIIIQGSNAFSQEKKSNFLSPEVIKPEKKGKAPTDAIVLFDKGSLSNFESITEGDQNSPLDGSIAQWKVRGRKFTVVPGTPNIQTKEKFGDCQLHIEWKTPTKDVRDGKENQQSGNSGIYLMGKYEVQILNSFGNTTDPERQAGAIYGQHPPLVNASLKSGTWQVFDIIFTAPRFYDDGSKKMPGYFTVFHNGVLIQYHVDIKGPSHAGNEKTLITEKELPMMLQNHQNKVSFRNIWIRKL